MSKLREFEISSGVKLTIHTVNLLIQVRVKISLKTFKCLYPALQILKYPTFWVSYLTYGSEEQKGNDLTKVINIGHDDVVCNQYKSMIVK